MHPKTLACPQDSHVGEKEKAEAWARQKGSLAPRKRFHTVLTSQPCLLERLGLRQWWFADMRGTHLAKMAQLCITLLST